MTTVNYQTSNTIRHINSYLIKFLLAYIYIYVCIYLYLLNKLVKMQNFFHNKFSFSQFTDCYCYIKVLER